MQQEHIQEQGKQIVKIQGSRYQYGHGCQLKTTGQE